MQIQPPPPMLTPPVLDENGELIGFTMYSVSYSGVWDKAWEIFRFDWGHFSAFMFIQFVINILIFVASNAVKNQLGMYSLYWVLKYFWSCFSWLFKPVLRCF